MKRLFRNEREGKIAGICAGLGNYFEVDPVIIRLLFVFGFFLGGGILVYLIAWIVIPKASE